MGIIVGITGASGSLYGVALVQALHRLGREVHLVVSKTGEKVIAHETGLTRRDLAQWGRWHEVDDLFAPIASGSFPARAMVITPCSMHTLGAIAQGLGDNLMTRAAGVTLKEGRPLILVPRETPLHLIHLENMTRAARAGARILPASPGFYQKPQTIADLVDFVTGKTLDLLAIPHQLFRRWGEEE